MAAFRFICAIIIFSNILINIYANNKDMKIKLSLPRLKAQDLKVLLERRYSCRSFQNKSLNLDDIATVLWATGGKKQGKTTRTIPSAGAIYPLELYILIGKNSVDKLREGVYHYSVEEHSLEIILDKDIRLELSDACLGQDFIAEAPVSLVIAAKFYRTTRYYGERGKQYVYMEAGHAAQNTYLAVTNLGLGTVEVGAFIDESVGRLLNLERDCTPLIVMPIGYPKVWGE